MKYLGEAVTQFGPVDAAPEDADMAPIAGVSLELYAEVSKGLVEHSYDQSQGPQIAASKGISAESWAAAVEGWNERIKRDRSIAERFNALYLRG